LKNWLQAYRAHTVPLIAYYSRQPLLKSVDGRQSIAAVFADLAMAIGLRDSLGH